MQSINNHITKGLKTVVRRSIGRISSDAYSNTCVPTEELLNYAKESERIWFGDNESTIQYSDSKILDMDGNNCNYNSKYTPKPSFICELSNCSLVGPGAVALLHHSRPILETTGGNLKCFSARQIDFLGNSTLSVILRQYIGSFRKSETFSNTPIFPLVPFLNRYYYHWLLVYLPKIRMLELYESITKNKPRILVPSNPPKFVTESLSLLGYDSDRQLEWDGHEYKIDNLLITNHRHGYSTDDFKHLPSDYIWLRNRFIKDISRSGKESDSRIYISRQNSTRGRDIMNYNELISELESRGFKSYSLETMGFEEQIRLLSNAEVLIGPHGAGLANMIFANNPLVVEILPEDNVKPHFYLLADSLGYRYDAIVGKSNDGRIFINVEEMKSKLDSLGIT